MKTVGVYEIRKTFKVEMSHQLQSAVTAACHETIHGHSYRIELFLRATELNKDEMVMDFGGMSRFRDVIMEYDHALVVPSCFDSLYIAALKRWNKKLIVTEQNPTAEYLARKLYDDLKALVWGEDGSKTTPSDFIVRVRVHETETGYAEYPMAFTQVSVGEDEDWDDCPAPTTTPLPASPFPSGLPMPPKIAKAFPPPKKG